MNTPLDIQTDVMERGEINWDEKLHTNESQSSPTITNNTQDSQENSKISYTSTLAKSSSLFQNCIQSFIKARNILFGNKDSQNDNQTQNSVESHSEVRRLEWCPTGYPFVATFLDSDENFMIYRRFGYLQARLLLNKQDELRSLEEKLDIIDKRDEVPNPDLLQSRDNDEAEGGPRRELLKTIEIKFREYSDLLCAAQQLVAMGKPAPRNYTSVKTWFDDRNPLVEDENYIQHQEDVITLKPGRENAWLDGFVEIALRKLSCPLILSMFQSKQTRAKTSDPRVIYFTRKRIDLLVTLIITAVILLLLIVPVYILWQLSEKTETHRTDAITIGVILTFTLVFSAVLSFFTRAQRHEILGAAAAYCAVMVVFISNVGN